MIPVADDRYYMSIAIRESLRSPDPTTKVGVCIVKDGKVIGLGYNHMPNDSTHLGWNKQFLGDDIELKYHYVCYGILNAFANRTVDDVSGSTVYATLFPSNHCAQKIVLGGVKRVVYTSDKKGNEDETKASRLTLEHLGIDLSQLTGEIVSNDVYNMAVAIEESKKSTHVKQTGACIVDANGNIVGRGFNGYLPGVTCADVDRFPIEDKELFVASATVVAMAGLTRVDEGQIYLTHFPENESAKIIAQAGIRKIFYRGKPDNVQLYDKTIKLLSIVNVELRQFDDIVPDAVALQDLCDEFIARAQI